MKLTVIKGTELWATLTLTSDSAELEVFSERVLRVISPLSYPIGVTAVDSSTALILLDHLTPRLQVMSPALARELSSPDLSFKSLLQALKRYQVFNFAHGDKTHFLLDYDTGSVRGLTSSQGRLILAERITFSENN